MDKITVLRVPVDGNACLMEITPDLETFQSLLDGGYLEGISGEEWAAYTDEEGKLKGLGVNTGATAIALLLGWQPGDVLCGPVVFVGPVDDEGRETSVSQRLRDILLSTCWADVLQTG